jgi:tetratricopeptide (TPR) repeat protein
MGPNSRRVRRRGAYLGRTCAAFVAGQLLFAGATASAADPAGPPASQPSLSGVETIPPPSADADAETYARCMRLARQDPRAAEALALSWKQRGGAHPAAHCAAVALISLGKYGEAARELQALARSMTTAPASLLAGVLDQAAQARLLSGDPKQAFEVAREAAALAPKDLEIVIDRAEAAAAAGYIDSAVADLDRVLTADPNHLDALIYRASANRALHRLDPARADIDKALALAPQSTAALLERGNIRRLAGDRDGAMSDWEEVDRLAPGSPEDVAARANLEHLREADSTVLSAAPRGKAPAP